MKIRLAPALTAGVWLLALVLSACGGSSSTTAPQVQGSVLVHNDGGGMTELLGYTWTIACVSDPPGSNDFFESLQFAVSGTVDDEADYASTNGTCVGQTNSNHDVLFVTATGDQPGTGYPAGGAGPVTATRVTVTGGHQGTFLALGYVKLGPPDILYVTDDSGPKGSDGYPLALQSFGRTRQ